MTLLKLVLKTPGLNIALAQLDGRIAQSLKVSAEIPVRFVANTLVSRLVAEWRLVRNTSGAEVVLCFHGLPPLLPVSARVVVAVQNRLLLDHSALRSFPVKTRMRLMIERLWFKWCQSHASEYVVQTASMARLLRRLLRPDSAASVSILPFADRAIVHTLGNPALRTYDFVYVASGDPHKNHETLLQAWQLLAQAGLRPSLALTVDPGAYPGLVSMIARDVEAHGLAITNLGHLEPSAVDELYAVSGALVYPSLAESFGLPLIEAQSRGMPILAPELDYVRDVADPAETFDAESPVSLCRAIRRFMGRPEQLVQVRSADEFVAGLLT
ncbi:MAG: glycosyltransferase [Polaromonas sp.]